MFYETGMSDFYPVGKIFIQTCEWVGTNWEWVGRNGFLTRKVLNDLRQMTMYSWQSNFVQVTFPCFLLRPYWGGNNTRCHDRGTNGDIKSNNPGSNYCTSSRSTRRLPRRGIGWVWWWLTVVDIEAHFVLIWRFARFARPSAKQTVL